MEADQQRFSSPEVSWHRLLTREAGTAVMQFDLLVAGEWSVHRGNDHVDTTDALAAEFPDIDAFCRVEPVEDPRSYEDYAWVRVGPPEGLGAAV